MIYSYKIRWLKVNRNCYIDCRASRGTALYALDDGVDSLCAINRSSALRCPGERITMIEESLYISFRNSEANSLNVSKSRSGRGVVNPGDAQMTELSIGDCTACRWLIVCLGLEGRRMLIYGNSFSCRTAHGGEIFEVSDESRTLVDSFDIL